MELFLSILSMSLGIFLFLLFYLATAWRRNHRNEDMIRPYQTVILTVMFIVLTLLTEYVWVERFRYSVSVDMAEVSPMCFIMMAVGFLVAFAATCVCDIAFRVIHLPRFVWEHFQKQGMCLEEQSRLYAQRSQQQTK